MSNLETSGGKPVWLDGDTMALMKRAISREKHLSVLLMTYIITGLVFMLLPGTFLGVVNLLSISHLQAAEAISPGWMQAHGHAQVFGWIGTFILGIGYYSIPKLRKMKPLSFWPAWTTWVLWTLGVLLRWSVTVWPWHWRELLPLAAVLELAAFLIFFFTIGGAHSVGSGEKKPWEVWIYVVILATLGLFGSLILQLSQTIWLARHGESAAFPHAFDQRYVGIPGADDLGIQRAMDYGVFGAASAAAEAAGCRGGGEHGGSGERAPRMVRASGAAFDRGSHSGGPGAAHFRAVREETKSGGRARQLPGVRADCVRLDDCRRGDWDLGGVSSRAERGDLGRVAACADGGIYRGDGVQRRAAGVAVILRNARAGEQDADVRLSGTADAGMHATRRVGDSGLSGIRALGMGNIAGFGADRDDGGDAVCDQSSLVVCKAAGSGARAADAVRGVRKQGSREARKQGHASAGRRALWSIGWLGVDFGEVLAGEAAEFAANDVGGKAGAEKRPVERSELAVVDFASK